MSIFGINCAKTGNHNKITNKIQGGGAYCTNKIVQKCLSSLVSLFLMLGMVPQNAFVEAAGVDLVISSLDDLLAFRDKVNDGKESFSGKTVKLEVDLEVSSVSPWVPIGTYSNKFKGTFDGGDHKITGLHIDSSQNYQGLFGYVDGDNPGSGRVENLTLEGVTCEEGSGNHVGGICGYSYGTISNCVFKGTVTGSGNYVGGICGSGYYTAISNCTVTGDIKGGSYVGGICGYSGGSSTTISNCVVYGTATGTNNVGGIVGGSYGTTQKCASFADVSGNVDVGGIAGACTTVTDCYATGNISGESEIGGVVGGPINNSNANDVTSSYFSGTLSGAGHDYEGNKLCYIGGINGHDVRGANQKCFCLAPSIEGSDDPAFENIKAFMSAVYLEDKPGSSPPSSSYPAIPDNDEECFYRADLGEAPGIGYDGEPLAIEPGWQQKFVDLGWDEDVWNIPPTDPSDAGYSTEALPTLKGINAEQNPQLTYPKREDIPDGDEGSEEGNPSDDQNSHLDWGEREMHGGILHYVNAEGMTSVEISEENTDANGIVWLREESEGTAAWYGIDNSASTFESGSRFYVQWLNTAEHPESFAEIDEETRQQVEENRGWLFKIGVIAPDGTRYSTLSSPVKVYVQIGDDWDKDDLQGFYVQQGADENVEVSYVEGWPYPEGTDEFGVMQLSHFSPYFIYDKDGSKSQNPATNDELSTFVFLVMSGVLAGAMFITFAKLSSMRRKNDLKNYFTNTLI